MPTLTESHSTIEAILESWREAIGRDYPGYRGHVYRMFNFTRALHPDPAAEESIAVAAAFHDIGIWTDGTFDYLDPSCDRAMAYIKDGNSTAAADSVACMINLHHKFTPCSPTVGAETEAFRLADLADVSLGLLAGGVPRSFIRDVRSAFPNAGFHACLGRIGLSWFLRHPLRPMPMLRW